MKKLSPKQYMRSEDFRQPRGVEREVKLYDEYSRVCSNRAFLDMLGRRYCGEVY